MNRDLNCTTVKVYRHPQSLEYYYQTKLFSTLNLIQQFKVTEHANLLGTTSSKAWQVAFHAIWWTHLIWGWGVLGVSSQMCGRLGWTRLEPSIAILRLNMFNSVAILMDDNIQAKPCCYKAPKDFDFHKSPPLDVMPLTHFNPVYTIASPFYKIHFNSNFSFTSHKTLENLVGSQIFGCHKKCTSVFSGALPQLLYRASVNN